MVTRLTTVLCWIGSFKNRRWANRWNNDGAVRLIMCSRRTAVSSKKDDGGKICFQWRAQNGVCRHLHLRSGHAITSLQNKPRRSEASKWEEMVKTTGLIGRQAGQANSPPACGPAGYLNGVRPGSELGRQVAVDFESDADFHECGSCPVHSCLQFHNNQQPKLGDVWWQEGGGAAF